MGVIAPICELQIPHLLVVLPKVSGEIKNADNGMDARQRRNASFVLGIFSKLSKEIKNADNGMDARQRRNASFVRVVLP